MNDQELNQLHAAASAIAAFQLSLFCFSALVQNGIVPKSDAERVLRQTVQTNKTGGPGNQAAADLLAIFLDQVTKFQPHRGPQRPSRRQLQLSRRYPFAQTTYPRFLG